MIIKQIFAINLLDDFTYKPIEILLIFNSHANIEDYKDNILSTLC